MYCQFEIGALRLSTVCTCPTTGLILQVYFRGPRTINAKTLAKWWWGRNTESMEIIKGDGGAGIIMQINFTKGKLRFNMTHVWCGKMGGQGLSNGSKHTSFGMSLNGLGTRNTLVPIFLFLFKITSMSNMIVQFP